MSLTPRMSVNAATHAMSSRLRAERDVAEARHGLRVRVRDVGRVMRPPTTVAGLTLL
jgi:hypothetical protein